MLVMNWKLPPWEEVEPIGSRTGAIEESEDYRFYWLRRDRLEGTGRRGVGGAPEGIRTSDWPSVFLGGSGGGKRGEKRYATLQVKRPFRPRCCVRAAEAGEPRPYFEFHREPHRSRWLLVNGAAVQCHRHRRTRASRR